MKTKYFNSFMAKGLVCCGIAAAFTGCNFEDEDYFDKSAALRIESVAEDIQQTLVNAPNGWVMQYFTGTDEIEGFNLFAKFESSQKVTMAGNHKYLRNGNANKYTEYVSLYEILKEDGPVLAFNTWNDVLTPLIDPVDPSKAPNTLDKDGEGMKGDHNLVVVSFSPEEVTLRGERHNARVRLVPCNQTWEEYIEATNTLKNYIANTTITNYYVVNENKDTLYFKNLRSGVITYCERINDPLFPSTVNCLFTPTGFRLHHQNNINGINFQEFTIAPDSSCLVSENDSVRVIACWDNYVINRTAVWNFVPEEFTAEQQELYNQIDEAMHIYNKNYSLASIGTGRSSGSGAINGLVCMFYTNTTKTRTNTIGMALDMNKLEYGKMRIARTETPVTDRNLDAMAGKVENITQLVDAFIETITGDYELTPDNYFLPASCQFTAISGGKTFKLTRN